eukprot:TRINITY_DN4898_c0_g1_i1.p2 TRINITY_DN4898_c0_g1~~TRINITY_DN4898_c0_g1_i1.p2  ORF type:complete len:126 (+),score=3.30 TRINITY_DN4898_c0_g1_i1:117-494(+)
MCGCVPSVCVCVCVWTRRRAGGGRWHGEAVCSGLHNVAPHHRPEATPLSRHRTTAAEEDAALRLRGCERPSCANRKHRRSVDRPCHDSTTTLPDVTIHGRHTGATRHSDREPQYAGHLLATTTKR